MTGNILTDDAAEEERKTRDNRIAAEQKLRGLMGERRDLFQIVDRLSEEVMDLQRRRQSLNDTAQSLHGGFRDLGAKQRTLREERGRVLDRLDELTNSLYQKKSTVPRGAHGGYRRLGAEIASLEKAQQTKVMSLKEENALIDKIRQMRQQLTEAEKLEAKWMEEEASASGLKKELEEQRKKLAQVTEELDRIRVQRDEEMGKVKSTLAEIGHVLTEIRTKGRVRMETLDKVRAINEQMGAMGKKVLELANESRSRVHEARKAYRDHNEAIRHTFTSQAAQDKSAETNLSNLFKNGKIQLGMEGSDLSDWTNSNSQEPSNSDANLRRRRG